MARIESPTLNTLEGMIIKKIHQNFWLAEFDSEINVQRRISNFGGVSNSFVGPDLAAVGRDHEKALNNPRDHGITLRS